jgi:hypothetical protein
LFRRCRAAGSRLCRRLPADAPLEALYELVEALGPAEAAAACAAGGVSLATSFPRAELPPRGSGGAIGGVVLTLRAAGLTGAVSVLVLLHAPAEGA